MPAGERAPGTLPSREAIRRWIAAQPGRVGRAEIARAFGLPPDDKLALRGILAELKEAGALAAPEPVTPARLPETAVVEVVGIDADGEAIARPVEGPSATVFMRPERRSEPALAPGARVLAALRPIGRGRYEGRTLRRLSDTPGRVLGVFRPRGDGAARLEPADRRVKAEWRVPPGEEGGALPGEIVRAVPLPHGGAGLKPVRVVERLGPVGDLRSISLLCIADADIPDAFGPDALAEAAAAAGPPTLDDRTDLRGLPLVTIDGADARDFDDAVWAEPAGDGFRLLVAIADVAHYVPPGSALDREARRRGNSVYFPDRVVPMLPEALSAGWCSLRPGEDRACLFVELEIGADGRKRAHRFGRGLMRSAARLTYEGIDPAEHPHLFAAGAALLAARHRRGALDLDRPEREVVFADGAVLAVRPRERRLSHRLVEEFMILANVAAAEELERLRRPGLFRVHAPPTDDRLDALRTLLHGMDLDLPAGDQLHPRDLQRLLDRVGPDDAPLLAEAVLRAQSQAEYSPDNIGHFGLALPRYAHLTSPIRRYADLLVHRALLGPVEAGLADLGAHLGHTERRAEAAERDAVDRFVAASLRGAVGRVYEANVSGLQRYGIFVTVRENGAHGLVPTSRLPDDFWRYDERTQTLSGRHTRLEFRLRQPVAVRLLEADVLTGAAVFELVAPELRHT